MTIVCQTPYKTWMNSPDPDLSAAYSYADEIVIKIDQGKNGLLFDVNGMLRQYDTGGTYSENFIYIKNPSSLYNNCSIINNSDTVLDVSYTTAYGGTTKVNMMPYDVFHFVAKDVTVTYLEKPMKVHWIRPPLNGGIENISWGKVNYDHTALSGIFDRYYAGWFIVDPTEEGFRQVLQDTYNLHKEQIDRHYAYIQKMSITPTQTEKYKFGAKSHSETKGARSDQTEYGARSATDMTYDYPVNVSADSANASKGERSTQNAATDSTSYGQQNNSSADEEYENSVERSTIEKPIGVLEDSDRLRSFYQYFIDCFRECFTLFEAMTW